MKGAMLIFAMGLLVVSTIIFCGNPVSKIDDKEIIPLKVGNWWEFDVCTTYSDGFLSDTVLDTLVITRDTLINDTLWYISDWVKSKKVGSQGIWANFSDGLWIKAVEESYLWIKYPTREADTNVVTGSMGINIYITTISEDSTIEVPAGEFAACLYQISVAHTLEYPDTVIAGELSYAPGAGPGQFTYYLYNYGDPQPFRTTRLRLKSYHLE